MTPTNQHPITPPPEPIMDEPTSSLLELTVDAIIDASAAYGTADEPARAAIHAVADWLEQRNGAAIYWCDLLRGEVK